MTGTEDSIASTPFSEPSAIDLDQLAARIKDWGQALGFQQVAITDTDLHIPGERIRQWLHLGYQGTMDWMASHGEKRWHPEQLLPGTMRVIAVRMDYLAAETDPVAILRNPDKAYISRYALGRDYHKLIRRRLAQLCAQIESVVPGAVIQRPFVDSAPVLEKPLGDRAGLGWIGKNTLLLNSVAGSWFFLGEIYTSLPLPVDSDHQPDRCGNCSACLTICPTRAFPAPYQLDARRCISYLTIEHDGDIPEPLRPLMGNRVFGCDDCQLVCPWNRYARPTDEQDFRPRHGLADSDLATLLLWSKQDFEDKTAGSPIRRIGFERWQRNLAVGIGNGNATQEAFAALDATSTQASPMVREHLHWARRQLLSRPADPVPNNKPFPALKHIP